MFKMKHNNSKNSKYPKNINLEENKNNESPKEEKTLDDINSVLHKYFNSSNKIEILQKTEKLLKAGKSGDIEAFFEED